MSVQPIKDIMVAIPARTEGKPSKENIPSTVVSEDKTGDNVRVERKEVFKKKMMDAAADLLQGLLNREVKMAVDGDTNRIMVKIIDAKTGDVVREIPPEEILNISKKLTSIQGILFDKEA
ncbi:MAG: flagellar protein FlaG [Deltaproteobacteria bacterium]|nr:flagellar protein FlaG [Deltaproteobacteria bacterium]